VRTALVRLEHEGLVEREPNRGAKVRLVDEQEAGDPRVAHILEGLAARHAAQERDPAQVDELRAIAGPDAVAPRRRRPLRRLRPECGLHGRLLEIAPPTVARLVATLSSQLVRFQYRTILLPGRAEQSHAEHRSIVDAVASHDSDAAEQAVRDHVAHIVEALRDGRLAPKRAV
jgi:DNA-binding GntR family transcriptional regulator